MSADTQRFARVVLAAFEAAGRSTDTEVSRAGGPSTSTMTKLRNAAKGTGDLAEPRAHTWAAIESVAGWPAGTAKRVWNGAEPPDVEALAQFAQQAGENESASGAGDKPAGVVRFIVKNVYGAEALVVEVPPENVEALEAAVDRIMRRMQRGAVSTEDTDTGE